MSREKQTRLLAAYTPEHYEGAYPPYWNVTHVGSMIRITMRGATLADGTPGADAVAVVNHWTLARLGKLFAEAATLYSPTDD
jgi:hypothetical protein